MADRTTIDALAERLFAEHKAGKPFASLRDSLDPTDLDTAYAVQEALQERFERGGRGEIVGYKIALTSAAMQTLMGIDHPLAGAIFGTTVHAAPATLRLADFQHLGLECEMAVRLATDMPAAGAPYAGTDVAAYVADCLPAFELVDDRNADYDQSDAASLVADNAWNGGVVLGTATADWHSLDIAATPVRLAMNGETAGEGLAGDAMGHPFEAVAWLANLLATRGRTLRAGKFVMTGSTVTIKFPSAGDTATYTVRGLGEVSVRLV